MEAYQPADKQVGAIFGSFFQCLAEELSVADGTVEDAIEDMRERFALMYQSVKSKRQVEVEGATYHKILGPLDHLPGKVPLVHGFKESHHFGEMLIAP